MKQLKIYSILNGYRVPARSRVMINAWAIGRDPNARAVRLVAVPTYRLNCSF
jgi:ferulate-5-hydroxylase